MLSGSMLNLIRLGMEWLTLPIFLAAIQLPQAVLVYWATSSSCALVQVTPCTKSSYAPLRAWHWDGRGHRNALRGQVMINTVALTCSHYAFNSPAFVLTWGSLSLQSPEELLCPA